MGKKILAVMALLLCCVFVASGCASALKMDNSGNVSSNGGFTVQTNDYVYFINGIESYSTTYKTGKVTKGALMRTAKANLKKLGDLTSSDYETVVSKLIVSSDYTSGFYIYGDYVYYAAPSDEKNKKGEVKSDQLLFFRTKLDGTSTSTKISSTDFNYSAKFRFYENGGNVYLAVYDTDFYVFDAVKGKQLYKSEDTISELIFDSANAGKYVYYTVNPINDALYNPDDSSAQAEKYHFLYRIEIGAQPKAELVLAGSGKYTVSSSGTAGEFGFTGATFDLIHLEGGILYFSFTSLDSTISSTTYVGLSEDKMTASETKDTSATLAEVNKSENQMNYGDSKAASIFADTSIYLNKDCILYIDSTLGLLKYDYTKRNDSDTTSYGKSRVYSSDIIKTATISFVKGDYLYYKASNVYYRINLTKALAGEKIENAIEELQINALAMSDAWYVPEVVTVDGTEYFLGSYTGSYYYSYVYAVDMTALAKAAWDAKVADEAEKKDEDKTHLSDLYSTEEDFEKVTAIGKTILGVRSDADNESFKKNLDTLEDAE